jgi:hypothetical protein
MTLKDRLPRSFTQSLTELAANGEPRHRPRLEQEGALFLERATATLRLIQSQGTPTHGPSRMSGSSKKNLTFLWTPSARSSTCGRGRYRSFLKKTIAQRIEDLVETASLKASVQINKFLLKLGSAHWATLRVSVRRGGRYLGAGPDYEIAVPPARGNGRSDSSIRHAVTPLLEAIVTI